MDLPVNQFKRLLGKAHDLGTWLSSGSPATAEALGCAGFDFLVVDIEHTPIDMPQMIGHPARNRRHARAGDRASAVERHGDGEARARRAARRRCCCRSSRTPMRRSARSRTRAIRPTACAAWPACIAAAATAPCRDYFAQRGRASSASSSRSRRMAALESSRRSPPFRAWIRSSSARTTSRRRWAISATPPIPRCRPSSSTPPRNARASASPAASSASPRIGGALRRLRLLVDRDRLRHVLHGGPRAGAARQGARPALPRLPPAAPACVLMASPFTCVLDCEGEPGRVPGMVRRRACALLGRHQCAVAQPLRPRHRPQRGDADARIDRLLRAARVQAASSSRCAAASGSRAPTARSARKLADAPYDPAHHRFNDGRCDAQGRFFAGTMNEQRDAPTAALYRIDADGRMTRVLGDMTISNGLAWSPDGRTMYHADTPTRTIHAYDYDAATGTPSRPRVFARFDGETDRPDGARGGQRRRLLDGVLPRRQGRRGFRPPAKCWPNSRSPRLPDDVRVRRRRSDDALRDHRAPEARRRRARAAAAIGRHLRDAGRRAGPARTRDSPAEPRRPRACFDSCRLPASRRAAMQPRDVASGAVVRDVHRRRARGHVLTARACSALRVGPQHAARLRPRPRQARRPCDGRADRDRRRGRSPRETRRSRSPASPLRFRLLPQGRAGAGIDHRRALPRLRPGCRRSAACGAATSGPPRSRSRPASRSTGSARNSARSTSAASSCIRRSTTRSASTPASPTRTRRSRGVPGDRQAARGASSCTRRAW